MCSRTEMSFGLRSGQVGCLDVTSPHGWPMPPRPPTTRRPHTVPTMLSTARGRRPVSIAQRPAWDYSSTKTNRTQAIDYSRVKTDSGPSLFNRHEIHQSFYYETRPAIHRISDGLTDRLKATQAKADAVVFPSRMQYRSRTPREPREKHAQAEAQAIVEEPLDRAGAVNTLFWTITEGKLPNDIDKMWRRPKVGKFAWSV